jgi:hypothetical protein
MGRYWWNLLDPLYSWDRIWIPRKRKQVFQGSKIDGIPYKKIPTRSSSAGGRNLWQGKLVQTANPLLRLKPRTETNQY